MTPKQSGIIIKRYNERSIIINTSAVLGRIALKASTVFALSEIVITHQDCSTRNVNINNIYVVISSVVAALNSTASISSASGTRPTPLV